MPNIIDFGMVKETLPILTNPATSTDIANGKEAIGSNKEIITGTATLANEIFAKYTLDQVATGSSSTTRDKPIIWLSPTTSSGNTSYNLTLSCQRRYETTGYADLYAALYRSNRGGSVTGPEYVYNNGTYLNNIVNLQISNSLVSASGTFTINEDYNYAIVLVFDRSETYYGVEVTITKV